ncbi:MAG TPA: hypothetical protein VF530_03285 [Planctomycetota bacterium]
MARTAKEATAVVGVADHCGWAVLVTVAGGALLDRRRVELLDDGLPRLPHHHEAQGLPLSEAEALIERVRASTERHAATCLAALAGAVSARVVGIALRRCPPLPATLVERLASTRAQNVADSVMTRQALAEAAAARGWSVTWYEVRRVHAEATRALGHETIHALLARTGAALGPPWQEDHRLAMAAAIAAAGARA